MESRMHYNHSSVCCLQHARFHLFIIVLNGQMESLTIKIIIALCVLMMILIVSISYVYNLSFKGHMESRMPYNHPSVCRFRHARFRMMAVNTF